MQLLLMDSPAPPPSPLSVSSIGSEAMQPNSNCVNLLIMIPFSILNRIGGDATHNRLLREYGHILLSVSSIGSEAMQPRLRRHHPRPGHCFQYPQSDRRRCNEAILVSLFCRRTLSVSSIGSEAMQLWW